VSDRLKDLQRQRALAQEQAAALEREIAREMGTAAAPTAVPSAPTPTPAPAPAGADTHADELIERYAPKEKPLHEQVKQGCLIYLALAFGAVGLCILALYIYHHLK
jgi:hypothetical protein